MLASVVTVPHSAPSQAPARLDAEPASIEVQAGATAPLRIVARDQHDAPVPHAAIRVFGARTGGRVTADGVLGLRAGTYELVALHESDDGDRLRQAGSERSPRPVTVPHHVT